MTPEPGSTESAREDLAFLRNLVEAGDSGRRQLGQGYLVAGLCYGLQMMGHAVSYFGHVTNPLFNLIVGVAPTIVFLGLIVWLLRRDRPARSTVTARTVAAVFSSVGWANIVLIVIIGSLAWRQQSLEIWLLYPCAVMVMQGAAWLVAYQVRRERFAAIIAAGWLVSALAAGLSIGHQGAFIAILGAAMLLFMALPGYLMIRNETPT